MNRLQSPAGRAAVLRDAQPHRAIDPAKVIRTIPTPIPSTRSAGVRAQRRHAEISGRNRTHYCGAYWGWGFHEDGVVSALGWPSASGRGCERQRDLRGHDPPPPPRGPRPARVPPPAGARLHRPRRAARPARRAPAQAPSRARALPPARLPRDPQVPLRRSGPRRRARPDREPPGWPDPAAYPSALLRALLQPGELLLLLRRRTARRAMRPRRGHQHALGRAPRLRAGRRRHSAPRRAPQHRASATRRCMSRRSWGWTTLRART